MRPTRQSSLIHTGIILLLLSTVTAAQERINPTVEILTNDRVVTMVKAGLPSAIIVTKIQASKTNFDTNTDELIRLQKAQVPAEIINAMVTATTRASTATSTTGAGDASKADPNDPAAAHEAGIYLYQEKDGQRRMIQLDPSVSKQSKTGGVFTSAMTGGLTKIKFKAALASSNASLQLDVARPIFYFYFEVKNAGLSNNTYYATNPNEFVLVKFDAKSNSREVTVSQMNAFGAQSGTMDKAARGFTVEKLGPGVFRVTPQMDLTDGEYGFYNGGGVGPSGGAKIFDFGIKLPR
jgi:hypothetical protein